ncbi:MAG TPA: LCP family protein [Acidimicrobiales bacterium]|jgi:LCP family protein required for cell wall assembly
MAGNNEFPGPILGGQIPIPRRAGESIPSPAQPRLKPAKRRRSTGERVLRIIIIILIIVVVLAASGYGYFRYEWGQIKTAVCPSCVAVANGAPYNVLVIGSDTRTGETAAQAQQFGNATTAGGQRSDTIKIVHVDPASGTASTLSIPRDTFVTLSGVPASSGVSTKNKINAAFAVGPNDPNPSGTGANGVVQTVENTFGIPISHWIVVNFFGLTDAVNGLGGIKMNFPYPVKDYGDCNANGVYSNCTGLNVPTTGCQSLNGTMALALSRSRHFEYYKGGTWVSDYSSDIGRITRQNLVIEAVVNKAKSTYNPIQAASFISSLTHDVTLDDQFSSGMLLSLAERYHAFSGSSLQNYTITTVGASYAPYGGEAVQVVQQPQTQQTITQFLGGATGTVSTPPLDGYGSPIPVPTVTPTTAPATTATTSGSSATTAPAAAASSVPSYDPTPC